MFQEVVQWVERKVIPENRIVLAIKKRNLAAPLTDSEFDQLKAAGAPASVLDALRPQQVESSNKKIKVAGPLNLTCVPAECEVSLTDEKGKTTNYKTTDGKLTVSGLQPGTIQIQIAKHNPNYEVATSRVLLEADKEKTVDRFVLTPTLETRHLFGKQRLASLIQALGGKEGMSDLSSGTASGEATIWSEDGKSTAWSIKANWKIPGMALMDINGAGHETISVIDASTRSKAKLKPAVAWVEPSLQDFVRLFRDFQLPNVLDILGGNNVELLADPGTATPTTIQAKNDLAVYYVTLNDQSLPTTVRCTLKVGPTREILYSQYKPFGRSQYPTIMQLKPDSSQRAIQMRFAKIAAVPGLTEQDFRK
ncbi:MAG: hypothetical protein JO145_12595 [Acidobacteriaceae bacterium]|nr:hypothetical protein [Acidobacteriaceae bacterium]